MENALFHFSSCVFHGRKIFKSINTQYSAKIIIFFGKQKIGEEVLFNVSKRVKKLG